jgi:N-acetylneuraminic acid mutarotase
MYSLSVPYSLASASYSGVFYSTPQDFSPLDFIFNPNGTKLYLFGGYNKKVYQHSLTTAYDITTASYDSVFLSVDDAPDYTFSVTPSSLWFNDDGTVLNISYQQGFIVPHPLSTAYDIGTGVMGDTKTMIDGVIYSVIYSTDRNNRYELYSDKVVQKEYGIVSLSEVHVRGDFHTIVTQHKI